MKSIPTDEDEALRQRILARSQAINIDLVSQLTTVADALSQGRHHTALLAVDGLERQLQTMRSFLLLL